MTKKTTEDDCGQDWAMLLLAAVVGGAVGLGFVGYRTLFVPYRMYQRR